MLTAILMADLFWKSTTMDRESVFFVDGRAGLLYDVEALGEVTSADQKTTYTLGKDFQLAPNKRELVLLPGTTIPSRTAAGLYPPKDSPQSLASRAGHPGQNMLWSEGHFFHDLQVSVTYTHKPGKNPTEPRGSLPKTVAKLRKNQPLTIAVTGDSISQGYNASAFVKAPPFQPPYPNLVAAALGTNVTLKNFGLASTKSADGLKNISKVLDTKPDLIIVAFGMNDIARNQPKEFKANIAGILDAIRPTGAEVILVASMLGNPDWIHTPPKRFAEYRDILAAFTRDGIALADMTAVWQELLKRKRFTDLTGNGVNHPNDFGHRLYAQVILGLLQ